MNVIKRFSENEADYHLYQSRQNYPRQQKTIPLKLKEALWEKEAKKQQKKAALIRKEAAIRRKKAAMQKEEAEKATKEAALKV